MKFGFVNGDSVTIYSGADQDSKLVTISTDGFNQFVGNDNMAIVVQEQDKQLDDFLVVEPTADLMKYLDSKGVIAETEVFVKPSDVEFVQDTDVDVEDAGDIIEDVIEEVEEYDGEDVTVKTNKTTLMLAALAAVLLLK